MILFSTIECNIDNHDILSNYEQLRNCEAKNDNFVAYLRNIYLVTYYLNSHLL